MRHACTRCRLPATNWQSQAPVIKQVHLQICCWVCAETLARQNRSHWLVVRRKLFTYRTKASGTSSWGALGHKAWASVVQSTTTTNSQIGRFWHSKFQAKSSSAGGWETSRAQGVSHSPAEGLEFSTLRKPPPNPEDGPLSATDQERQEEFERILAELAKASQEGKGKFDVDGEKALLIAPAAGVRPLKRNLKLQPSLRNAKRIRNDSWRVTNLSFPQCFLSLSFSSWHRLCFHSLSSFPFFVLCQYVTRSY